MKRKVKDALFIILYAAVLVAGAMIATDIATKGYATTLQCCAYGLFGMFIGAMVRG